MGALTQQERDGLEDIFLSLSRTNKKMLISENISIKTIKVIKMAKIGLKEVKKARFIEFLLKKKKILSK
ncbi:MAG: hypothetical protein GXO30_07790 [Epsilonproteobacteria bacterium]|nr:hypothetical protein [Campylobacterota bacterium]